jgi:hypothetical protein
MRPLVLCLAIIAVLFILGIAVHTLVLVALVALVVWLVVWMVAKPRSRGGRRFSL